MKKLSFQIFAIVAVFALVGCITLNIGRKMPTDLGVYKPLPFKKIMNQAFAKDVEGEYIVLDASFAMLADDVGGAPREFRNGNWLRFCIEKDKMLTCDLMIPKEKGNILFELNNGELIKIYALIENWNDSNGNRKAAFIVYQVNRTP